MPSLTRRRALQIVGAASVSGLAGCTALTQESSEKARFGELTVTNYDSRQYTVHVVVLEGNELVYWDSKQTTPAEDGQLGGAEFEGHPTDPGDYVLHARLDGQSRSESKQLEFSDYEASCLGININIGNLSDERAGELSIWKATNPRLCKDRSTGSQ